MSAIVIASELKDRFASVEAIAADCVSRHNEATTKVENYTLRLAASCMVVYHDKGADKGAGAEVRRIVSGLKSEGYGKQISAWVSGNAARYQDAVRRSAGMEPMARVQAVLSAIGERAWRDVRSEHRAPVTGNSGGNGAADNPPSSATGTKGSEAQSSHDAMNVILKAIPLLESKADVMRVLQALQGHLVNLDSKGADVEVVPPAQITRAA